MNKKQVMIIGTEVGLYTAFLSFIAAFISSVFIFEQHWSGNTYFGPIFYFFQFSMLFAVLVPMFFLNKYFNIHRTKSNNIVLMSFVSFFSLIFSVIIIGETYLKLIDYLPTHPNNIPIMTLPSYPFNYLPFIIAGLLLSLTIILHGYLTSRFSKKT